MACRNLCERLDFKAISGEMSYKDGKKYCRICETSHGKFLSLLWDGIKKVSNWKGAKREVENEQIIVIYK